MDFRDRRIASAPASPGDVAECVSGVLTRNGAVLVEKRRADDEADPGLTLLPGGHVEPEESLDQALKREIREELGIRVEKDNPSTRPSLHCFEWREAENTLLTHHCLDWQDPVERS